MRRALALAGLSLLVVSGCSGEEAPDDETAVAGSGETSTEGSGSGGTGGGGAAGSGSGSGSGAAPALDPGSNGEAELSGTLVDAEGTEVGSVGMNPTEDGTEVSVTVSGLEPGFHGLHVHGAGLCEPDSQSPTDPAQTGAFLSAGGHVGVDASDHGAHTGDLPSLSATSAGEASMTVMTDAFTVDDLTDADGSALMVHSDADNFANVPERYAPEGPDQETLDTGDAGSRVACAVLG